MGKGPSVSVIILTLNAQQMIAALLQKIWGQTIVPGEIIVVDSESSDQTVAIAEQHGARVISIKGEDFNHGGTRDAAFQESKGDFVLFMTHDALPADRFLIERLLEGLEHSDSTAAVYARQLPRKDAGLAEQLIRNFNYPASSYVYDAADIPEHGIKTFFMSDVCAMYRRNIYEEIGGFEHGIATNEDMFYAANAIQHGYAIAYAAKAAVIHSHQFSLKEQYRRNFAQGYEMERHQALLLNEKGEGVSQQAEGFKLVQTVSRHLLAKGEVLAWIRFGFDCVARYAGNAMGRRKARREACSK